MPFNTAVSKMFFVIMCTQIRICSAFARPEIEMASIIHNKTAHQLVLHHCFIIVTLHAVKVITEHGLSATNNVLKTPKKRQSDGTQSSVMRLKETFSFFFPFFLLLVDSFVFDFSVNGQIPGLVESCDNHA